MGKYAWDKKTNRYGGTDALDTEYRLSLLNKEVVPQELTVQAGASNTVDIKRTEFIKSIGGVHRKDYSPDGDLLRVTYIPYVGEMVDVSNSETPKGETWYSIPNSAYSFNSIIMRKVKK